MQRLDDKSRMSGDVHVRFCERLEGRFLRATRPAGRGERTRLERGHRSPDRQNDHHICRSGRELHDFRCLHGAVRR